MPGSSHSPGQSRRWVSGIPIEPFDTGRATPRLKPRYGLKEPKKRRVNVRDLKSYWLDNYCGRDNLIVSKSRHNLIGSLLPGSTLGLPFYEFSVM